MTSDPLAAIRFKLPPSKESYTYLPALGSGVLKTCVAAVNLPGYLLNSIRACNRPPERDRSHTTRAKGRASPQKRR
jgi:hypothetical protein